MAEHAGITAGLAVDGFAIFKGYAQPLEAGQTPILTEGQPVKVVRFEGEENVIVVLVDDDGNEVMGEDGKTPVSDNLFPDELEAAEMDEDEPQVEGEAAETDGAADDFTEATEEELAAQTVRPKTEPEPEPEAAPAKPAGRKPRAKKTEAAPAEAAPAEAAPAEAEKPKGRVRAKAADAPAATETKAEAPKTEIKPTQVVEIKDMASVTAELEAEGGDALKAAKALVDRAEQTDFTLGGVLRNIHETGSFKTLGYDGKRGFDDYVEQTLGIASRKARYLIAIYTKFAMLGIDETKLNEIGWSKAKELARVPDADLKKDFNKLVKKANDGTRDDLITHIKTKYEVVTRGEQVQLKAFSFRLAEGDAHTAEEGLKEACTAIGEQDMNKAFVHIVGEWRGGTAGAELTLEESVELLVAKFGIQSMSYTDADGQEFDVGGEEEAEQATA